jgi:hypothetical protein
MSDLPGAPIAEVPSAGGAGAAAAGKSPPVARPAVDRRWLAVTAAFLLAVAVVAALVGSQAGSRGSTISRGPGGWLAARRYLEARGAKVTLIAEPLDRYLQRQHSEWLEKAVGSPLGETDTSLRSLAGTGRKAAGAGVLVLAFPWQALPTADLDAALDLHLDDGGDLVLAYSGEEAGAERLFGIWHLRRARRVPLAPWRWQSFMHREWQLRTPERRNPLVSPGGAPAKLDGRRPLRIWAPRALPDLGPGAEVLFTSPGGQPAAAVFRRRGGRVVVLPADALANARLGEAGNGDLLETLLRNLGTRWAFDEFHHGLVIAGAGNVALGRAADLLLAHLILLYLLAALALGRRQGPAWREPPALAGSAATFLLGLGALHDRLGHHRDAARQLLRRAQELDRALVLPPRLARLAESAGPRELVEIARQVSRRRAGHRFTDPGEIR